MMMRPIEIDPSSGARWPVVWLDPDATEADAEQVAVDASVVGPCASSLTGQDTPVERLNRVSLNDAVAPLLVRLRWDAALAPLPPSLRGDDPD
jgi:hypothetical protein